MKLNEQQEEFLKTFIHNLENTIKNVADNKEIRTTEVLSNQGNSDKEKEIIKDLCNEIDLFHQKKKELKEMKAKDPKCTESQWLKEEIIYSANEVFAQKENRDLTLKEQKDILLGVKEKYEAITETFISKIMKNKEEQKS